MVALNIGLSRAAFAAMVLIASGVAAGQDKEKDKEKKKAEPQVAGQKKADPQVAGIKTFSQTGWGGGSDGNERAQKLLAEHFEELFPKGLRVGRKRQDMQYFVIGSAEEVKALLPLHGVPEPMSDRTKAGFKAGAGLSGQLVAAKLNVAFDRAGLLGKRDELGEPPFSDLVFRGENVPRAVRGMTAADIIDVVDDVLAGAQGSGFKASKKVIDVDGDEKPDASLMDLREALYVLNTNFRAGADAGRALVEGRGDDDSAADSDEDEGKRIDGARAGGKKTAGKKAEGKDAGDDEEAGTDSDESESTREGKRHRVRDPKEDETTDVKREEALDRAEEERDDKILETDEARRMERARVRERVKQQVDKSEAERKKEIAEQEKEIDARHKETRRQIQTRFEENKARINASFEERHGRAHPGKGKGVQPGSSEEDEGGAESGKKEKKGGMKVLPVPPKKAGGGGR